MKRTPKQTPVSASTVVNKDGTKVQLTATPLARSGKASAVRNGVRSKVKQHTAVNDVLDDADDLVKGSVGGFVTFIREHAIVGLAVGFIIGTQAQAVIKQLVTSFIEPSLKLLIGSNLATRSFHLGGKNGADFTWGAMVYALINLLAVLVAIYALIKIFKLDQLDKPAAK